MEPREVNTGSIGYGLTAVKALVCSLAGIIIFFIPLNIPGHEGSVFFSVILNVLVAELGNAWLYFLCAVMICNAAGFWIDRLWGKKEGFLHRYYEKDSAIQGCVYVAGSILTVMVVFGYGPEAVIGKDTGDLVINSIVRYTAWILIIGGTCVPLLLDYGALEFIGTLLEPLMRPVYRLPGRSALNAIASFVSSSSIAVYITTRIYRQKGYTDREICAVATGFSAVSVGFAALAVNTIGLTPHFSKIFFTALFVTFLISIVMVRIPPLSRKKDIFIDGTLQTEQDRTGDARFGTRLFGLGLKRAVLQAERSGNVFENLFSGMLDGISLMPKVIPFLATIGISGLIVAEYTPFFEIIGQPLVPLYQLLGIPDAAEVAKATFLGIAEMLLPVLVVSGKGLADGARFFVVTMALVQIVFFSEPATMMLAMGVPIKLYELVIVFFQRTFVAIPIIALFMHILF